MEVVHYSPLNPWVGKMCCPACRLEAVAWRSSGMSECYPHFYCDRCSNAIQRESDKTLLHTVQPSQDVVDRIAATLPECPCGGRFRPASNPKCPHCGAEYKHQDSPVARLLDPHVILVDGARFFGDDDATHRPFQVRIGRATADG